MGLTHDFDRPSGTGALCNRYPGTSCLATISLSLRDKSHSPIKGLRIKLALMGLKPRAESCSPPGRQIAPNPPHLGAILVRPKRLTLPYTESNVYTLSLNTTFTVPTERQSRNSGQYSSLPIWREALAIGRRCFSNRQLGRQQSDIGSQGQSIASESSGND